MRAARIAFAVGAGCGVAVGAAGCGVKLEIALVAERRSIAAGGLDSTVVTARTRGFLAGTTVHFSADRGSFVSRKDPEDYPLQMVSVPLDGDRAEVTFYSDLMQGTGKVTATAFDDPTGDQRHAEIDIEFGQPGEGARPTNRGFDLVCDALNIGALYEPRPALEVPCRVTATTAFGDPVPTAALDVTFLTEVGQVEQSAGAGGEPVWLYRPTTGRAPVDVMPQPNEPSRFDEAGNQRNPGDGVVTILAVTDGGEGFDDNNGNGFRDPDEPFDDLPEPFLDVDDDGTFGQADQFLDANGNGIWDWPNGQYDESRKVFASWRMLWTGPPHESGETTRWEYVGSEDVPDGGELTLYLHLLDANMNPVAAFMENGDYVDVADSKGWAFSGAQPPLVNTLGVPLSPDGRPLWSMYDPPAVRITVSDPEPGDESERLPFRIGATLYLTPGPAADAGWLEQRQLPLRSTATGTVD